MKKIFLAMGLIITIFFLEKSFATASQQDIIFVLDNSGSRYQNISNILTKSFVSAFVEQLRKIDQVGIIIFDESARLAIPLTLLNNPLAHKKLIKTLTNMDFYGQLTNTPAAIERALYELHTAGRKDSQQTIVFLTDGIIDTGNSIQDSKMAKWLIEDLTSQCVEFGIKIFAVALSEKTDFHLIQSLTAKTKGAYFRTFEPKDVPQAVDEIIKRLTKDTNRAPEIIVKSTDNGKTLNSVTDLDTAAKPKNVDSHLDMVNQSNKYNTNVTTVKIRKNDSNSIQRPLIQKFLKVFLLLMIIFLLSVILYQLLWPIKTRPKQPKPIAQMKLNDSPDYPPNAQLLGMSKTGMNNSKPNLLFLLDQHKVTIGRAPQNMVVVPKSTVSNFHATIHYINGHFELEDNHSTNGTFLENNRLPPSKPVRLKHGDIIKFATVTFRFLRSQNVPIAKTMMLTEKLKFRS
ncbi:MAG: FHA domain-containing protein [Desulfobacteraceae bacterium]|jgi:hypothetical protein